MACALIDQNVIPIFRLPDELLMKICSYIKSIKHKMGLEQVSRRFNRVSSNLITWKGIHSLELMMKCGDDKYKYKYDLFKTSYDRENVHLNGVRVPYEKLSSAIESFLHRTELHQFTVHYGYDTHEPDLQSENAVFRALLDVFYQNRAKIKIELLEIHGINFRNEKEAQVFVCDISFTNHPIYHYCPVPMEFPNMERFDMRYVKMLHKDINTKIFFDNIKGFFELTHDGSVARRFTLQNLRVFKTKEDFSAIVAAFCQNNDIEVDFGEMKPTPYVHLSKGNSSYVIRNLRCPKDIVESDEDDADSDGVSDEDSDEEDDGD